MSTTTGGDGAHDLTSRASAGTLSSETPSDLAQLLAASAYHRPFRRYQQLALDAFDRARADGRRRAYLVLPPGAGKTVLGLEIARRLGAKAVILCPNTAVQAQWLQQWRDFEPATVLIGPDPGLTTPLTALTYQAICHLDTDDAALDETAATLWRDDIQSTEHVGPEEAAATLGRLAAAGGERYRDSFDAYRHKARTLVTHGGDRAQVLALLHANGRAVIERMKQVEHTTLVLDECHHLLETWGYLVRAIVEELGDAVFVVGLTATPPGGVEAREARLYLDLFGQADFEVPTPAVVKEGDLAPYQELAYLTQPLPHETDYIEAQQERFQRLLLKLLEPDFGSVPFVSWLRQRVGERRGKDGAQISWSRFERDEPALAQAAVRYFSDSRLDLPEGARLTEQYRQAPEASDWVAMLDDYCMRHLKASADPRDEAAWKEIHAALPSLGYTLTRQGVRASVSPVDRVLSLSGSKGIAAQAILTAEARALGERLHALVLCDYERVGYDSFANLRGVLDPQAGSAALLLQSLVADAATSPLNPVLLTGQTVACSRATAADLSAWLETQAPELRGQLDIASMTGDLEAQGATWGDLVTVRPSNGAWQPRRYVPLVTRYFEEGRSRCLVGTRGLLGEGWDCTCVNVLLDLTAAGTSTSVHQMRGRSLRLDPSVPHKVADNWDIVCVAPDHPRGAADYARFVRKHRHYYAPNAAGEIESGVSHVDPRLSPYGPPQSAEFAAMAGVMLERIDARPDAYRNWRIGGPYQNKETQTVRVRFGQAPGLPGLRVLRHAESAAAPLRLRRRLAATSACALLALLVGVFIGVVPLGIVVAVAIAAAGVWWAAQSAREAIDRLGPSDALEDFASALAEALSATGGISATLGPDAVRVAVQDDGYYRCYLVGASVDESRLFAESLDELLAPLSAPRYLIPRTVVEPPRSALRALMLAMRNSTDKTPGSYVVYHAVPAYLAANHQRVEAFQLAWNHHVSAGAPLYAQDPKAQGILAVQRGEDPFKVTTQMRTLWS